MTLRLEGKTALVTGGSSGIGKAIVHLFAKEGAVVACAASSDISKAKAVADEIGHVPGRVVPIVGDVSNWEGAGRLVEAGIDALGSLDILVTAAGAFYPTPIGSSDANEVMKMISINLTGTISAVNAVVPHMKQRGSGKIVNIASIAGIVGFGTYGTYCATKAGIISFVRALAIELAPHRININAIAPGNTETPMNEDIRTKPEMRSFYDVLKARTPSGRVYSKPEDMARAALYLASDDSVAMHGATMVLDEGFIAGV